MLDSYGATSPEEAIQVFMEAVQAQEFSAMRRMFGTKDGPAEQKWGVQEVEQRMIVLSGLLEHDSYSVRPLDLGYLGGDEQAFVATILGTRQGNVTVPITAVRSRNGRWFVQQLGMDSLLEGSL